MVAWDWALVWEGSGRQGGVVRGRKIGRSGMLLALGVLGSYRREESGRNFAIQNNGESFQRRTTTVSLRRFLAHATARIHDGAGACRRVQWSRIVRTVGEDWVHKYMAERAPLYYRSPEKR